MKPREHRQTVRVTARMKSDTGWRDVAIHNASAHGLKISVPVPMRRGDCIEIRRASQIIVARVMWAHDGSYGVRTQDVVDIPALVDPNAARAETAIAGFKADRRRAPRAEETAARSHRLAARLQYAAMGVAVLLGAGYAAWVVSDTLSAPFAAVSVAFGAEPATVEPMVSR